MNMARRALLILALFPSFALSDQPPPEKLLKVIDTIEKKRSPETVTNSISLKLALIPAGEFLMGAPESDRDAEDHEKPQHKVRISKPFYMGIHEVTVGQFR